ncbi:hypothetical protein PM10SUCC1_28380 [Propionigenium maris DSM 9537]|uniref:Uncharacterized protein n=1 Tax=Propionigenium maris DSM 9537 TaxID=1123000 RepID=A0A9W6GLJ5_9FUSO|nr:transcriptional regulator [Propionigenium maris]GLI57324.1 hypothetical protein PM10SUCC1_28380 [Propionigenium maris DSM 9537]
MKQLLKVEDVMEVCQVKVGKAYQIMKEVNRDMENAGYITIRGRVNSKFLCKKLGIDIERKR